MISTSRLWRSVELGKICDIYQPKTISKKMMSAEGKYPVFGANGIIGRYDQYNHEDSELLITCRGATCGSVNVSQSKSWITGNAMVVKPLDNATDRDFLKYFFCGVLDFKKVITGAAQPQITRKSLSPVLVPFPPLPEQQRIVAILDAAFERIDAAIANTEKNLANARELFESYLNEVVARKGEGWEEKKLSELGNITSSKRIFKKEYTDSGVPFYRTKEVKEKAHGRDISTELFISKERYTEIKYKFGVPHQGDILLTAIGTIGEIFVVDDDDEFYFKDGNVLWLKGFKSVNSYFLKYVLMSFVENIRRLSHGSAYNALPIMKLKEHVVYLPSIRTQEEIVERLDDYLETSLQLEGLFERKLISLTELKQSILQKAFAGELTDDYRSEKVEV
jgi:type I restriction enzyme S subunit